MSLDEALKGRRVFAEFPVGGLNNWMAACEVLIQERLSAWAFPLGQGDLLDDARRLYRRRAVFGIWGVRTPDQVREAVDRGAAFITSPVASYELLEAAGDTPLVLGALTPNEITYALGLGAPAIQVVPAEALGMAYARLVGELYAEVPLVAAGRLEPFQCDIWTAAGARQIGLAAPMLFGEGPATDMDALRRRCQSYGSLI